MYDPYHDSYLLADWARTITPGRLLEVGTGSGLVAITAARAGHRVTATDRSPAACALARANAALNRVHVDVVVADLLRGLHAARVDTILFNPPYLPTVEADRVEGPLHYAFDGGPTGRRVLEQFLDWLPRPLACRVYVVASSLQQWDALSAGFERRSLAYSTCTARALPGEELRILGVTESATRND